MSGPAQQGSRVRRLVTTFAAPILIAVIQLGGTLAGGHGQPGRKSADAFAILLVLLGPALLIRRREWPAIVAIGVSAVTLTYMVTGYVYGPIILSPIVAIINALRLGHRLVGWACATGIIGLHFILGPLLGTSPTPTPFGIGMVVGWTLVVCIVGEVVRANSERRLARQAYQEAEETEKVTQERLRLARELHDVVSHNISLINVQAGVALHLMDSRPEQARSALTAIKQASKEALVELRSVLGVLRQVDDHGDGRKPTPGLARLPELAERGRQAGLAVELTAPTHDELTALPDGVSVAAYRIIQEALTNVLRHAAATRIAISVSLSDSDLVVSVVDNGVGASADSASAGTGAGLVGMRERAEAVGGTATATPQPDGGFAVRAEIPYGERRTEPEESRES